MIVCGRFSSDLPRLSCEGGAPPGCSQCREADEHGHYRVALPPGQYILDAKGRRPGRLNATAHPFTVVAQQVVRVDMDIITGLNRSLSNPR